MSHSSISQAATLLLALEVAFSLHEELRIVIVFHLNLRVLVEKAAQVLVMSQVRRVRP
jgi:hypothetical protein